MYFFSDSAARPMRLMFFVFLYGLVLAGVCLLVAWSDGLQLSEETIWRATVLFSLPFLMVDRFMIIASGAARAVLGRRFSLYHRAVAGLNYWVTLSLLLWPSDISNLGIYLAIWFVCSALSALWGFPLPKLADPDIANRERDLEKFETGSALERNNYIWPPLVLVPQVFLLAILNAEQDRSQFLIGNLMVASLPLCGAVPARPGFRFKGLSVLKIIGAACFIAAQLVILLN